MTSALADPRLTAPAMHVLRCGTGVVIPVYLPSAIDVAQGEALLGDTVALACGQVADTAHICLSVDGEGFGADAAYALARRYGTLVHIGSVNRGKLGAAASGVQSLLANPDLSYVALVDQDGDHVCSELIGFLRVALHISDRAEDERVIVLGRRASRHRPMGFLRGELEEFADRILLDALAYRAAMTGRPLRLEYALAVDEFPDFHSGYKLFSRPTAQDVFLSEPQLEGVPESCYYRHGCEAVMIVEALEGGAYLGTVSRSTLNEQPITTFGLYNLSQLVADKIIWPCRRLRIPARFAQQWMANHAGRLLLHTLRPEGRSELDRIRRLVLDALPDGAGMAEEVPLEPLFV
jgi:hypothetical protein